MFYVYEKDGEISVDPDEGGYDETWTLLGTVDRPPLDYEVWDAQAGDWVVDAALQADLAQKQADNAEEQELKGLKVRRLAKRIIRRALLDMLTMQEAGGIITAQQKSQGETWVNNRYDVNDS